MPEVLRHYNNVNYHLSEPKGYDFFPLHLQLKARKYEIIILFYRIFFIN